MLSGKVQKKEQKNDRRKKLDQRAFFSKPDKFMWKTLCAKRSKSIRWAQWVKPTVYAPKIENEREKIKVWPQNVSVCFFRKNIGFNLELRP